MECLLFHHADTLHTAWAPAKPGMSLWEKVPHLGHSEKKSVFRYMERCAPREIIHAPCRARARNEPRRTWLIAGFAPPHASVQRAVATPAAVRNATAMMVSTGLNPHWSDAPTVAM
jgi:hypothetical protein